MSRKIYIRSLLIAVVLITVSSFYYLPYYVSKPGMAKELEPIVNVDGGDDASGSFMLTTVRMGRANIYSYLIAKGSKYQELYPEAAIRNEDETDEEYNVRQLHMMDGSKNSSIKVAYEKAGKPVSFEYRGVYVLDVLEGMPAYGKLKPGDEIIKVDDLQFQSSKQFIDHVGKKQAGDKITLLYKRGPKNKTATLKLKHFNDDKTKVGIGISLDDDKRPITNPEVSMDTDQIGGPSAGLMFTLEIYNQLTEGDITKGYQIAGTGTMSEDGTVGPIGGIQQKIVAADNTGADVFFAPNEKGIAESNYREALIAAKDIKTNMKIVPIDTVDDALKYLDKITIKK
ncbi:PDZ domain-containing protein [Peribacillus cavernae]|uniref:endopeptidase La n=1 Tax=Peribacillus cavernae TaxID=1674310 RepID=A0A3S0W108_9BACI|nr:SepM family pheromone-processing serine protease [Peribacillus cavernae]MDQ0217191.1 PDZ domain-containing protein [Peribacillus cavernae]RUQ30338.1 PDZ domain-containing protein [Peribacillus cavernae]